MTLDRTLCNTDAPSLVYMQILTMIDDEQLPSGALPMTLTERQRAYQKACKEARAKPVPPEVLEALERRQRRAERRQQSQGME